MITIGILALQGNFAQHHALLKLLRRKSSGDHTYQPLSDMRLRMVRSLAELQSCNGLIIPGGESTTMRTLLHKSHLFSPLRTAGRGGFPLFGVCAGIILLATRICNTNEECFGILDIEIERNGYGRQVNSFEAEIPLLFSEPNVIAGTFIRAPIIRSYADSVELLGTYADTAVVVKQGAALGSTFHPEVKTETALHRFFVERCVNHKKVCADYLQAPAITTPRAH